jgi:homoserine kinase type II
MAVFTPVATDALVDWLADYDIGSVREFVGIAAGIENSNFFLSTRDGRYVLTVFERLAVSEVPYYLELMRHLAARGVACPAPVPTRAGALFMPLCGKPAALVTRLAGHWVAAPTTEQCALAGAALAGMHLAGTDFPLRQPNLRGLDWWNAVTPEVLPHLDAPRRALLADELEFQCRELGPAQADLPRGPIHADLFRDNALFDGAALGGFIDFYFAGDDAWLFDVAVSVNDWCVDLSTGTFAGDRALAFLEAYAARRPFVSSERNLWPVMLRAAAFRFWLSRLWDVHCPRPATLLTPHDPGHFERILRHRRETAPALLPALPG